MPGTVNFKGKPLTLEGTAQEIGGKAPDFSVVAQDMKDVTLADYEGKVKVITTFLSLDTSTCDLQVKEFNKRATEFSADVVVLGISKDLPFAQKRFCETFKIDNVNVLSDYKTSSFGANYGLLVRELNLLARSVLILDKNNIIRYFQLVDEATNPPDYEDALKNLEEITKNP
jgi:thiol peroxidase